MKTTSTETPEIRRDRPRLYRCPDDPDYAFPPPRDPVRRRILKNILADCAEFAGKRAPAHIPLRPDSPHPFHQLYITFYMGMEATALLEQYSFAWRVTGDRRWAAKAKEWLAAAVRWEHSDRVEEHFYTSNRYMHALAVALDWLAGELSPAAEQAATECLVRLMTRWWPDVNANRADSSPGHHVVVDNGHFGVAALQLLGRHPDAAEWVRAVVERFRAAVMANGCGVDGQPADGPTFWAAENMWMLHFVEALRNVNGIDLAAEHPERLTRPLVWLRYHLAAPRRLPVDIYSRQNATILNGGGYTQLDEASPVLLRLAQAAGDAELRDLALRDPRLGRVHRLGIGVKNSSAECMYNFGPYAYLFYDPDFRARKQPAAGPPSRLFRVSSGQTAILRSGWRTDSLVAALTAYNGGQTSGFSHLHVQWNGHPVLKTISAAEGAPVACGSLPCIGEQNEFVTVAGALKAARVSDSVVAESSRLRHEYRVLRGRHPALLVTLRRKPRGVRLVDEGGQRFVRADGTDCLQYRPEGCFNAGGGELRLRVRLAAAPDPSRVQLLFHTGTSVPEAGMGTSVNTFALGFIKSRNLSFTVQSQRYLTVKAEISPEAKPIVPGQWHEIVARWGGFNALGTRPFIEIELDGHRQRCDDQALFGELGRDTQGLASRTTPRVFIIKPNTLLGFGAAIQFPDTGVACDFSEVELNCPKRKPLHVRFKQGIGPETGDAPIEFKLNPVDLRRLSAEAAVLGAGPHAMRVVSLPVGDAVFSRETVPYYPSGLAASSLKRFAAGEESASTRLRVTARNPEWLALLFTDVRAKIRASARGNALTLELDGKRHIVKL